MAVRGMISSDSQPAGRDQERPFLLSVNPGLCLKDTNQAFTLAYKGKCKAALKTQLITDEKPID